MIQPDPEELVPDQEALDHEEASVALVVGSFAAGLAPVVAGLLAAYAGGLTGPALAAWLGKVLAGLKWDPMTPALQEVAVDSVDLGVDRAVRDLSRRDQDRAKPWRGGPTLEVPDLDARTRERLDEAVALARTLPLETRRDLDAVVGRVSAARTRAEGQVRWTANEGLNAGTVAVADRLGSGLLWVAERDACLHCLAHAGWSVAPGDTFPPLTFGDRPLREDGVTQPPLHPGCRCQVRVWDGPLGEPAGDRSRMDPAARAAAEARRSVVYGWTSYASGAATLRAMERLLRHGAGLAPSVERRARQAVRQGRPVPSPTWRRPT